MPGTSPTASPGAELVAVMDVDRERARDLAGECGGAAVFDSGPALIGDPGVDAILIASPDPTHADLAVACVEAGKPVLCEKPLGVDIEDAKRVLDAEVAGGGGSSSRWASCAPSTRSTSRSGGRSTRARSGGRSCFGASMPTGGRRRSGPRSTSSSTPRFTTSTPRAGSWETTSLRSTRATSWTFRSSRRARGSSSSSSRSGGGGLASIEVNLASNYGYEVIVEVSGEAGTLRTPSISSPILRKGGGASRAVEPDWLERFEMAYRIEAEAWVRAAREGGATGPTVWGRLRGDAGGRGGGALAPDRAGRGGARGIASRPLRRGLNRAAPRRGLEAGGAGVSPAAPARGRAWIRRVGAPWMARPACKRSQGPLCATDNRRRRRERARPAMAREPASAGQENGDLSGLTMVLRLLNVEKHYTVSDQRVPALNGVSLDLGRGEWLAVVGRSGCGKTTLLNLAGAADLPTGGRGSRSKGSGPPPWTTTR